MLSMRTFFLFVLFAGLLGAANQDVAAGAEADSIGNYHGNYYPKYHHSGYKKSQDCKQTGWVCGECDKYTGKKTCKRTTLVEPFGHGKRCGPKYEEKNCAVDCKVTEFKYSACSKTCGKGHKVGRRHVIVHPKNYGKKCPALVDHQTCFKKSCPVDCKQGEYICGKCDYYTGYKTCTRKTFVYAAYHGKPCGPSSHKKKCSVDCKVSDFGYWNSCSKKCGGGYQKRYRKVVYHPKHGGKYCPKLYEERKCNIKPCSRDCVQTDFECGDCNYKTGYKKCSRKILYHPLGYGKKCGPNWKNEECKVDCKVSDYGYFGKCSKKCGYGIQKKCRKIIYHPKNGGKYCPKLCETKQCGKPCSRDCVQTYKCGKCDYYTGKKTCTRHVITHPLHHGKKCGPTYKTEDCDVDCKVSPSYGPWDKCSKHCGGGLKKRCRKIIYHSKHDGEECPSDLCEREKCNTHPCGKKYDYQYLGGHHLTIAGVCGFVLLAGAIKIFRKNNSGSYETLPESDDPVEREQFL